MPDILNIVVRILHVGSAIALLGGTVFFIAVMVPSLKVVDEGLRGAILQAARKRFYRISHPALLLLLVTGFYNFFNNIEKYKLVPNKGLVHGLMGVKILLALAVLSIVMGQTFGVIKGCPAKWAKVNIAMGVVIVILAAVVRAMRMQAGG